MRIISIVLFQNNVLYLVIPLTVYFIHLSTSPFLSAMNARPNTGRSYFEEKRGDLFHKYDRVTSEEAGQLESGGLLLCESCCPYFMTNVSQSSYFVFYTHGCIHRCV